MNRVILFAFWGRRENVDIQLPFIHRILDENPNVEFHGWNLSQRDKTRRDNKYIRAIPNRERFTVLHDHYNPAVSASLKQNEVWKRYAQSQYDDAVIVKIDDDTIFIETEHFAEFAQAAADNPGTVISALTLNNGCSTRHIPAIWDIFKQLEPTLPSDDTPDPSLAKLLAVHRSVEYADLSHRWFHQNWQTLTGQPGKLIATDDWLSINITAQTHDVVAAIGDQLAPRKHPMQIVAGRPQARPPRRTMGDEGLSNTFPRMIYTGLVAGHLTFGPQENGAAPGQVEEWRNLYSDIAKQYLAAGRIKPQIQAAEAVLPTPTSA